MIDADPILKVVNVSKFFNKQGNPAVNNVSITIYPGEIFGLVGAENSGKTTLLRMITGLTKISSGDIVVDGYNIEGDTIAAVKNIGAMISTPAFYSHLSGYENLKILASYYNTVDKNKINEISRYVGMHKHLHTKVGKYSLGMKQRLGIAQTLLNDPKLIILDEPTIGLDPNTVKELRNFLISVARKLNIAILISSRSEADVKNLCDTIAVLENGKITKQSSTTKVKQAIKEDQAITITVDYPAFAFKLIKNGYDVSPKLLGKTISFKAAENTISSIISKLNNSNISVFDMTTTLKGIKELIK